MTAGKTRPKQAFPPSGASLMSDTSTVNHGENTGSEPRAKKNVYWDCYRGYTTAGSREDSSQPDFSFEQIERAYYMEHYSDYGSYYA